MATIPLTPSWSPNFKAPVAPIDEPIVTVVAGSMAEGLHLLRDQLEHRALDEEVACLSGVVRPVAVGAELVADEQAVVVGDIAEHAQPVEMALERPGDTVAHRPTRRRTR